MWVWLVNMLDIVVLENTPSLPCPHTFHQFKLKFQHFSKMFMKCQD